MRLLALALIFAGCGFRGAASPDDGGGGDGGAPLPDGASGADLANAPDLATPMGGSGPGPLGALPTGYCCSANEQCRSRQCFNVGTGPYYCSDACDDTSACTAVSTQFSCDVGIHACTPINDPYTCVDGANYQYGGKPTGACCAGGTPTSGQPCEGGLCIRTGAASNPYYCTQGCNDQSPCPSGYTCQGAGPGTNHPGTCWITATVASSSATYTCQ